MEEKNYVKREKIYRNIRNAMYLIFSIFFTVAVMMYAAYIASFTYGAPAEITETVTKISFLLDISLFLIIASGTCMMLLPFIKALNEGKDKPICIAMIVLSSVCCLIWLIDFILRIVMLKDMTSLDGILGLPGKFNFVRISLICSLQILPFVCVFMNYVKYRKTKMFLQVATVVATVAYDVLFSYILARSVLTDNGYVIFYFKINWVYLIYAIAPIAVVVSVGQGIYKRIEKRNKAEGEPVEAPVQDVFSDASSTVAEERTVEPVVVKPIEEKTVQTEQTAEPIVKKTVATTPFKAEPVEAKPVETAKPSGEKAVHDKLKELKQMLDEGLITEEAYAKKRDDLIDKL